MLGRVGGAAAPLVERVLGGSTSVRRRLERAGLDRTVQEFRVEQVVWGLVGFAAAAALTLLRALGGVGSVGSAVVFCGLGLAFGVFARDNRLSTQVKNRERQVLTEFPTIAELLALSVAAGESPVSALDRVVRRSHGALSEDLSRVLARVRTGEPVGVAFESLAGSTVTLKLKSAGFRLRTRARHLLIPTQLANILYESGTQLLAREVDGTAFRLIGIGVSGISPANGTDPVDLIEPAIARKAAAERAMDRVRDRFGKDAVIRGKLYDRN